MLNNSYKNLYKAVFFAGSSQLPTFVFRAHAFQTTKRCVFFFKKFLYESCLKNHIDLFLKKANT